MFNKVCAVQHSWPCQTINHQTAVNVDPLGNHLVIWHTKKLHAGLKQQADSLMKASFKTVLFTNHDCQKYQPVEKTNTAFQNLTTYFSSKTFNEISLDLEPLQSTLHDFQRLLNQPSVIHVYDCCDVNQAILKPTDAATQDILKSNGYEKYGLFSNSNGLSAFIFIPTGDIAMTPPHSHYSKKAITVTWNVYETSIDLPPHLNQMLLQSKL